MEQTNVDTDTLGADSILTNIVNGTITEITPEVIHACLATLQDFANQNLIPQDELDKFEKIANSDKPSLEALKKYYISTHDLSTASNVISSIDALTVELNMLCDANIEQLAPAVLDNPIQTDMFTASNSKTTQKRADNKKLKITYNGDIYMEPTAIRTYMSVLNLIGLHKISKIAPWGTSGRAIVTRSKRVAQSVTTYHASGTSGYFIDVYTNAPEKVKALNHIAKELNLDLTVELL